MTLTRTLARPLVFVTGKGGTGKTTVAEALARVGPAAAEVVSIAETDPRAALSEWLAGHVGGFAAGMLNRSEAFSYLVAAAPGAAELLTIGKVADVASRRRVIADGPATGHALAMLSSPRTYAEMAPAGPIAHEARALQRRLEDPAFTAYVGVALPEPMAVAELLELDQALPRALGRGLDLVVVNAVHPDRFSDDDAERLREERARCPLLRTVLVEHRRARRQAAQVACLREQLSVPVIELPFVFDSDDCVTPLAQALKAGVAASTPSLPFAVGGPAEHHGAR
jgi:anion-transporting  ArsA/GET3 family ATPase